MPAFGNTLSDKQIADVAAYLRGRFTDEPTWGDMGSDIESVRKGNAS
jgi:nicotinate dehydrogenase subunit B